MNFLGKIASGILLFFAVFQPLFANDNLLKEITSKQFSAKKMGEIVPMSDGKSYATITDDKRAILKVDFEKGTVLDTLFSVEKVEKCPIKTIEGFELDSAGTRILLHSETKNIYRRSFTTTYYIYHVGRKIFSPLSENGDCQQMAAFSPNGRLVAFARDNNLFLKKLDYDTESVITTDGELGKIINGTPDWVYEEEFKEIRLFEWSKNSELLAFLRFDETNVNSYSFQWFTHDYPTSKSFKYPRAGGENSQVDFMVYNIRNRTTKKINFGDEELYFPSFHAVEGDEMAVACLSRNQKELNLRLVNLRSGVSQLILKDQSKYSVDYANYDNIQVNSDGSFVCLQEKSGFRHLYLYAKTGLLQRQLTSGNWDVTDFYGYDEATKTVYYQMAPIATERHVEKCDSKGKRTILSEKNGWASAIFSRNYSFFVETFSTATTPDIVTVKNSKAKTCRIIEENLALKAKFDSLDLPKKEFFQFSTSEGVVLNGWLMKPQKMEEGKRYPLLLVQYSGPNSQEVKNCWKVDWEVYLAQKGVVVACVDGRGTGARGTEFRNATYGRLGELEAADQTEAARYFATKNYIDPERIGIWGWSYGGFTTLAAMTNGSGIFRAGIAVAPVVDWRLYDTVYTEHSMNRPQENGAGYENSNLLEKAKNLQGRLLIIHGTADDNVHLPNTLLFTEKLVEEGKQFEMQLYTNKNHSILGDKTRLHLYTRMSEFIFNNL